MRRPPFWPAVIGVLALVASVSLTRLRGVPIPETADEFSYLLAADTFARGRLANAPHPFWQHFESPHVLQQPSYASKYPPGQGLVLAVGQRVAGHPIVGVWASTAVACAAVAWAALGWLPPPWAAFASLIVAFHPVVLGLWGQSYWGGAVAVAGGALVTGAVPRLVRNPRVVDAVWLAVGAAILAISRPYEGAILVLLAVVTASVGIVRHSSAAMVFRRVLVPAAITVALAAVWIGYYNQRVTGDPFRMPYVLHHRTYEVAPLFVWQTPRPEPDYRHRRLREQFVGWGLMRSHMARVPLIDSRVYDFDRSGPREWLVSAWRRVKILALFGAHPELMAVLLVTAPFAVSGAVLRTALILLGGSLAGLFVTTFLSPHYAAPSVAIAAIAATQSLRHLRLWRWNRRALGRWIVWFVIVVWGITTAVWLVAISSPPAEGYGRERHRLVQRLSYGGQRHLLIVRYPPSPRFDVEWPKKPEWVYNGADIDSQPVVFAREMDAGANRALAAYFRDRRIWLFEPEADPPKLTPYPSLADR